MTLGDNLNTSYVEVKHTSISPILFFSIVI